MPQLGNIKLYIAQGTKVYGVVFVDKNQNPIAGAPLIEPLEVKHGDWVQVEFSDPKREIALGELDQIAANARRPE